MEGELEHGSDFGEYLHPYVPLTDELKEEPLIDEFKEELLIDEPKEEPLIDEFQEEPLIDEPKDKPLIDEFKEEPLIDEPKDKPLIDEFKEEPLIDERKEGLTIDEPKEVLSIDEPEEVVSIDEPNEILSIHEPEKGFSFENIEWQSAEDSSDMVLKYDEDEHLYPPISTQQIKDERNSFKIHDLIILVENIQQYLENSNRFCRKCLILFATELAFLNHNKNHLLKESEPNVFLHLCYSCNKSFTTSNSEHTKTNILVDDNTHESIMTVSCDHCNLKFPNEQLLIAHLYDVVRKQNSNRDALYENEAGQQQEIDVSVKTNALNNINEEEAPAVRDTQKNHQEYILKSALFKCNRCNIHFLNSQLAKDHVSHMDILINWKCSICKHIFKKNDEKDHMLQHSVTNDFTIYNMSDTPYLVLYICTKCNVHFDEITYFQHFPVCRADNFEHAECVYCGIWLDVNLNGLHNCNFQAGNSKSAGFIVVKTDLIKKDTTNQDLGNINKDLTINSKVLRTGNVNSDMSTMTKKIFNVYYCKNCKCFVNNYSIMKHKTAKCGSDDPKVCISCGLIYPKTSTALHAKLHKNNINVTLQDFVFHDLDSEQLINPPFPEFPQCGVCEITFARKYDKARHCCGAEEYTICSQCNSKFSELGYKIHMYYHDLTSSHLYCNEESPSKRTKYGYKIYRCKKCQICITHEESSNKHICSSQILKSKCSICGLYWKKSNLKNHNALHLSDSNFIIDNITLIDINRPKSIDTESNLATSTTHSVIENLETKVTSPKEVEVQQKTNVVQGKVVTRTLYRCSCGLHFLDRISTLVHQNTTCHLKKNAGRQKCSKCGLLFDSIVFFKHLVKHHREKEETTKFHIIDIAEKKRQY